MLYIFDIVNRHGRNAEQVTVEIGNWQKFGHISILCAYSILISLLSKAFSSPSCFFVI